MYMYVNANVDVCMYALGRCSWARMCACVCVCLCNINEQYNDMQCVSDEIILLIPVFETDESRPNMGNAQPCSCLCVCASVELQSMSNTFAVFLSASSYFSSSTNSFSLSLSSHSPSSQNSLSRRIYRLCVCVFMSH